MLLFLFLLFPLSLLLFCVYRREKRFVPLIVIGAFTAVLICFFRILFTYAHRLVPYSFPENLIYSLTNFSVVPVVLLYGIYFLLTKDSIEVKVAAVFPLLMSFYMIYLPYKIVSASEYFYTGYSLFLRPAIYLSMVMQLSFSAEELFSKLKEKNVPFAIIQGLIIILYLFVPAVCDSLYAIAADFWIVILISGLFAAYPLFNVARSVIKDFKKK